ncbi:MAG: hypothetical protein ACRDD1_20665, partial [Planctomycetia bacterium]
FTPPGPPWTYPTTTATIAVTVLGKPATAGWVTLFPVGGPVGDPTIGRIGPDGRATLKNVPIGPMQIRVTLATGGLPLALDRFDPRQRDAIQRRIRATAGPGTPFKVMSKADESLQATVDLLQWP